MIFWLHYTCKGRSGYLSRKTYTSMSLVRPTEATSQGGTRKTLCERQRHRIEQIKSKKPGVRPSGCPASYCKRGRYSFGHENWLVLAEVARWQQMKKHIVRILHGRLHPFHTYSFRAAKCICQPASFLTLPTDLKFSFCKLGSSEVPNLILLACKDSRKGKLSELG